MFSFIVLCVAGYLTFRYFRQNPSKLDVVKAWLLKVTGHKADSASSAGTTAKSREEFVDTSSTAQTRPEPVRKTLTELYGPFPCDGTVCNPYETCSELERLFCRDVLSKVVEKAHFKGQYTVKVDSGYKRIDFAVDGFGKNPVAIEIDGYACHVENLDRKQFSNQLKRQNELVKAGWRIIRFSFEQVVGNPTECRRVLEDTLAGNIAGNICIRSELPEIFTEFVCKDCTEEEREELKRRGAIFSDVRKAWYMPATSHEDVANTFPERKLNRWKKCPHCEGSAFFRTGDYGDFWSCQGCKRTFNS